MTQTRDVDLISLDQPVPTCTAHPSAVSYVRCRRCDRPACHICRTPSRIGLLCRDCVAELRQADSDLVAPPLPTGTLAACVVLVLLAVAQTLTPATARYLAFAPFAAVTNPWRFLTGLVAFAGHSPALVALPFIAALALGGWATESLRGPAAMLTTALTSGVAGFATPYIVSGVGSAGWYSGLSTPAAAMAGLVIAGASASIRLRRRRPGLAAGLAALLLAAGCLLTPVPPLQLLGGVLAALLVEVLRLFFHKPQRHITPLLVSGISTATVVLTAIVIAAFVK